ncbi:MAG TPA: DUF448 domain-containing protein [Polyangiales bacterium]|nr:DUF448 domain-containing protein [Polyangiales bacterium]
MAGEGRYEGRAGRRMNVPATESSRACAGCRQREDREALLRFVAGGQPPQLAPDIRRRAPGRGVSVHPRYRCVEAAVRSGALRRGLGLAADPTADVSARQLSQTAAEQYKRRATGLLQAGHRARKLALGTEAVRFALSTSGTITENGAGKGVHALLIAHDAEGSREELARAAERLGARCLVWSTKEELGRLFGRAMLSIVGVLDAGIATELRHVVRCAAELAEDA